MLANRGQGFRTRLKSRVVYLNDGKGHSVALVQVDLPAASLLLHHKVAEAVAEKTGLKPGDIAITASHSHSAPANIFDNDFYNKHMSSGEWLETNHLEFLTGQIAQAFLQAHENRRPAKVATGCKDIFGYNRNRALTSYVLNTRRRRDQPGRPAGGIQGGESGAVHGAGGRCKTIAGVPALAAFSIFSVHATALTPPVEVYNADLFAYAQKGSGMDDSAHVRHALAGRPCPDLGNGRRHGPGTAGSRG